MILKKNGQDYIAKIVYRKNWLGQIYKVFAIFNNLNPVGTKSKHRPLNQYQPNINSPNNFTAYTIYQSCTQMPYNTENDNNNNNCSSTNTFYRVSNNPNINSNYSFRTHSNINININDNHCVMDRCEPTRPATQPTQNDKRLLDYFTVQNRITKHEKYFY